MAFIIALVMVYLALFFVGFLVFLVAGMSGDEKPWNFKRIELFYPACYLGVRLGTWLRSHGVSAWLWGSWVEDE